MHGSKANDYYDVENYEKYEHELSERYKCLKNAREFNKNHSTVNYHLGRFFYDRGLYRLAIKYMSKSIEFNPLYYISYRDRGIYYSSIKEYDKAEADFKKALEFEPDDLFVLRSYMRLLLNMKRYEEAENVLSKTESISPESKINKSRRAMLYFLRGDKDKVIEEDILQHDKYLVYKLLKKREEVLLYLSERLERIKKSKKPYYLSLKNNSMLDFIRVDPRFQEILATHKKIYEENLVKYQDPELGL